MSFNTHFTHYYFQMDNISSAIRLMKPGCYLASIDLKDAYYSVPISTNHQKFLKFEMERHPVSICVFPEWISTLSSKIYKAAKASFFNIEKTMSHFSSILYIDDSWLTAENFYFCIRNVVDTIILLDKVGFVIHPEKSVLLPTQTIVFLGFVLDSVLMQVSLTQERALKLKEACKNLLATASPCIR